MCCVREISRLLSCLRARAVLFSSHFHANVMFVSDFAVTFLLACARVMLVFRSRANVLFERDCASSPVCVRMRENDLRVLVTRLLEFLILFSGFHLWKSRLSFQADHAWTLSCSLSCRTVLHARPRFCCCACLCVRVRDHVFVLRACSCVCVLACDRFVFSSSSSSRCTPQAHTLSPQLPRMRRRRRRPRLWSTRASSSMR